MDEPQVYHDPARFGGGEGGGDGAAGMLLSVDSQGAATLPGTVCRGARGRVTSYY